MLLLDHDLSEEIENCGEKLPESDLRQANEVSRLKESASQLECLTMTASFVAPVIDEQGFAQIRGLKASTPKKVFAAISSLLGDLYIDPAIGSVHVSAHVAPDQELMGNQLRSLPLHTDYSMLANPPRLTISRCIAPDPTENWGILKVADVEAMCFGLECSPEIEPFFSVRLPFASMSAGGRIEDWESPIITNKKESQGFLARYHRSRIHQAFRRRGEIPSAEQYNVMLEFERRASQRVESLSITQGDITFVDNHRTLHGRTRCSCRLHHDASITGRQMDFIFAY